MSKVRIYALAKDLGVDTNKMLAVLNDLGVEYKSSSSTLDEETVEAIKTILAEEAAAPATEAAEPASAAPVTAPAASAPRPAQAETAGGTARTATARGRVTTTPEVIALLRGAGVPKGDALGVARLAGIMGAKQVPDLIPLCHPIALAGVTVELTVADDGVDITAVTKTADRTGVEMEAITAVAIWPR